MSLTPEEREKLKSRIVEALKTVYDPEIPINVYDLGLVYDLKVDEEGRAHIKMTLTAPGCPLAGMILGLAEGAVKEKVPEAKEVRVELVWNPPWTPDKVTPDGREALKKLLGYDLVGEWLKSRPRKTP